MYYDNPNIVIPEPSIERILFFKKNGKEKIHKKTY